MIIAVGRSTSQNVDRVSWITGDDGFPVSVELRKCLFNEHTPECRIVRVYTCKDCLSKLVHRNPVVDNYGGWDAKDVEAESVNSSVAQFFVIEDALESIGIASNSRGAVHKPAIANETLIDVSGVTVGT